MVGETVTLHTDVTEIQEDELIRWKFADSKVCKLAEFFVIAKWDKTNNEEYLHDDNKFKDRLHLDHDTGSLVITNITPEHYGHYKLHITSEGQKISKTFNLIAHVSMSSFSHPSSCKSHHLYTSLHPKLIQEHQTFFLF